jgi:nitrile hydratase accessory protein
LSPAPDAPAGAEAPVFRQPWEAQVFALVVALSERGVFAWSEWTAALAAEAARQGGEAGYDAWLGALESLLVGRGVTSGQALRAWREAWDHAARSTPHGRPIVIASAPALS